MCRRYPRIPIVAAALALTLTGARADVVTDWNQTGLDSTAAIPGSGPQVRIVAMMHGAMFDAVNAIEPRYRFYLGELSAPPGASVDAAAASAGHAVLAALVPAQKGSMRRWPLHSARLPTVWPRATASIWEGVPPSACWRRG